MGDDGIPTRDIAAAIGAKLWLPIESVPKEYFSWVGDFFALDTPTSSKLTQRALGWKVERLGLIADLEGGTHFTGNVPR